MALRMSQDLKNTVINHIIIQIAGTTHDGGAGTMQIYTGSQPADADTAPSGVNGTLLCQIYPIRWAAGTCGATAGTAALTSATGYFGTAEADGTAGWARLSFCGTDFTGSAGTYNIDGDVGTASNATFVINAVAITNLSTVTLLTAPISIT